MDSLTREPTGLRTRHRPRVWLTALLCLLAAAGIVYVVWFWPAAPAGKGDRDAHVSAEALRGQLPADEAATAERAAEGFLAQKPSTVQTARTP